MSEQMIQADSSASEKVCDHPSTEKAAQIDWDVEAACAALLALAEYNVPCDIQELLVQGDPMRSIPPGAIAEAFKRAILTYNRSRAADADGQVIANPANSLRSEPESSDPSLLGRETVREALREIVARTYSTDRRCRLDYEPVAEICDIAKRALASLSPLKE